MSYSPDAIGEIVYRHVAALKSAYPHLPLRLDPDLEVKYAERLAHWHRRIAAARAVLDTAREARTRALEAAPPTDLEARALHELYAIMCPLIARQVVRYYRLSSLTEDFYPLQDALHDSYELFVRSISCWDPARARLSTWLTIDLRGEARAHLMRLKDERRGKLEFDVSDYEHFSEGVWDEDDDDVEIDFAAIAERLGLSRGQWMALLAA